MNNLVTQITIETKYGPPIVIDHPLDSSGASPNPLLDLLKPRITVQGALGTHVYTPYGDPGQSLWSTIRDVLLVLLLVAAGAVVYTLL